MVSRAVALLESLEPLELVVCKMATLFHQPFTVADLGASWSSVWAGCRFADHIRVLVACHRLAAIGILECNQEIQMRPALGRGDSSLDGAESAMTSNPSFGLRPSHADA